MAIVAATLSDLSILFNSWENLRMAEWVPQNAVACHHAETIAKNPEYEVLLVREICFLYQKLMFPIETGVNAIWIYNVNNE